VAVDAVLVVAGQDEQLLAREHAVEQGQDSFLFLFAEHLLELVEHDHARLVDVLNEGVEAVTAEVAVDDQDGHVVRFNRVLGDELGQHRLARTLFAGQQHTSAVRAIEEGAHDAISTAVDVAVDLAVDVEVVDGLQEEASARHCTDRVRARGQRLVHVERRFRGGEKQAAFAGENGATHRFFLGCGINPWLNLFNSLYFMQTRAVTQLIL